MPRYVSQIDYGWDFAWAGPDLHRADHWDDDYRLCDKDGRPLKVDGRQMVVTPEGAALDEEGENGS